MSSDILNTLVGIASFGEWGNIPTFKDPVVLQQYLDFAKKNGIHQLDTARGYGNGTSEEMLGSLNFVEQGFLVDTKLRSFVEGAHSPEKVKESMQQSLAALRVKKVHILYLHAPDRTTPFKDTLQAVNELYQEGCFEKFGLSNYTTEQVEQILQISRENNYVLPSVYQGNYNAVTRKNEETLFPLLRKEKISFYAYSPVAAGFFNLKRGQEGTGRFDDKNMLGSMYQKLYFKDSYFNALEKLSLVSQKFGLSNIEVAIRWIYFHSQLKKEFGDSVLFGISVTAGIPQLESNLVSAKKGPLPEEVVKVLEEIWGDVKGDAPAYHM